MNYYFLILGLSMIISGCAVTPATITPSARPIITSEAAEYRKITADQAKEKMDETADWVLLDVRTDEEFKEAHIENAILIPDDEISSRVETEIPNKNTIIFIYCRSGRRSANAAYEMIDMGYTNVYDFGGIIDWPYETINGE